jgi:hypothetical protein
MSVHYRMIRIYLLSADVTVEIPLLSYRFDREVACKTRGSGYSGTGAVFI